MHTSLQVVTLQKNGEPARTFLSNWKGHHTSPRHQTHTNLLGKAQHILFGMWNGLRTMHVLRDGITFCQTSSNEYHCKGISLCNCAPRAKTCARGTIMQWQQYVSFAQSSFVAGVAALKDFLLPQMLYLSSTNRDNHTQCANQRVLPSARQWGHTFVIAMEPSERASEECW